MATKIMFDSLTRKERTIYIDEPYTENAIQALKECIVKGQINPANFETAIVVYDCNEGINENPESMSHYPLRFRSDKQDAFVFVSGVTAGYGGTGPHGTVSCLEIMGFELTEAQKTSVLTKEKTPEGEEKTFIQLTFTK